MGPADSSGAEEREGVEGGGQRERGEGMERETGEREREKGKGR